MSFEEFESVIKLLEAHHERVVKLEELKVGVLELFDDLHKVVEKLFEAVYGKGGYEWISWFCYDRDFGSKTYLTATDAEGNKICTTLLDLWAYLTENYKQ